MNIRWSNGDLVLGFWVLEMLLNEKNVDDDDLESRAGVKNQSELLQQLLKPDKDSDEDRKSDRQSHGDDPLLRSLGFPPSPSTERPRKRPSEDRDDGPSSKREAPQVVSSSGNSLRERNKMLASLLAKEPVNNQPIPPVPAHEITATPQEKLPRITDPNKNIQLAMAAQSNAICNSMSNAMNAMMGNAMGNTRMNINRMPGRSAQTTSYLNAVLTASTLQQRNDVRQQLNQLNSNCYPATSSTNSNTSIENNNVSVWDNNNLANQMQMSNDPLLSDILDEVIDIVPDDIMQLLEPTGPDLQTQGNNFQARLSETMAIEVIQKSLMQYESVVKSTSSLSMPGTPPAYSTANLTNQMGVFSHPSQAAAKLQQRTQQMRLGSVAHQYQGAALTPNQQQLLLQKKKILQQQQQQEKHRLLMQQRQQHLLIPSNAAVNEINTIENIDSLLNNTVAPNVALKRSSSVPEPQLSPGYSGQMTTQAQRVGSGQPYSPHSQSASPLGQQSFTQTTTVGSFPNPGQRLSPQSQFNAQLSPRQAYPQAPSQNSTWQQQAQVRLTMQQNPMLTAQLTRPSPQSSGQAQPQQQRSLNSPSAVVQTRHSPYPADQFPPPTSPNSAFNNQYLRLQRANSAPTATTQLPGGLGSPRPYGREHHHSHPPPSPYHPSLPPPPHPQQQQPPPNLSTPPQAQPMMYQQHQDSQYCSSYDPMGYPAVDRGRPVPPPHLQPGVSASGPTSEFVRQELRAVVGARTAQTQPSAPQSSQTNARGQQSQLIGVSAQQATVTDLESLGITFEMPSGASDSPKLWGAMGSDMGSMSPQPPSSRTSMEETRQGDQKSSLLQKLLSE